METHIWAFLSTQTPLNFFLTEQARQRSGQFGHRPDCLPRHNCKGMGAKIPREWVRLHQSLKGWAGDIPREWSGEPRNRWRGDWRYNLGSAVESQGTDGEGTGHTTWGVQWRAKGQTDGEGAECETLTANPKLKLQAQQSAGEREEKAYSKTKRP